MHVRNARQLSHFNKILLWINYLSIVGLLAAMASNDAKNQVYNIAVGERTTLNELFNLIHDGLIKSYPTIKDAKPVYQDFRKGDVKHSLADISKAKSLLGYLPSFSIYKGLEVAMPWYIDLASQ